MDSGKKPNHGTSDPWKRWDYLYTFLFVLLFIIFFTRRGGTEGSFFFLIYPCLPLLLITAYLLRMRRHLGRLVFGMPLFLGILALLVSCLFCSLEVRHRIHRSSPPVDYRIEIEKGKEKILGVFSGLMDDMKSRVRLMAKDPDLLARFRLSDDRAPLFDYLKDKQRIQAQSYGVTLYDNELDPLAWRGHTNALDYMPAKITSPDACGFFLIKNEMTSILMVAFPVTDDQGERFGYVVLERFLTASYQINNPFLKDLDYIASSVESPDFSVAVDYLETGPDHRDLVDFFMKFKGNYWGRSSRGLPILRFPLETADRTLIASATIEAHAAQAPEYYPIWFWTAMALILFAAFSYPVYRLAAMSFDRSRGAGHRFSALAGSILLLWCFRILLQKQILESVAYSVRVTSPDDFYLYGYFNLWSSPLAFMLTAAAILGTLIFAVLYSFRGPGVENRRTRAGKKPAGHGILRTLFLTLISVLTAQAAIIYYLNFIERVLKATPFNLATEALSTLKTESLLFHTALSCLFLSLFLFIFLVFFHLRVRTEKKGFRRFQTVLLVVWSLPATWMGITLAGAEPAFPYLSAVAASLLIALLPGLLEHYWRQKRLPFGKVTLGLIIFTIFSGHALFFPGFFPLSMERKKQYIRDQVIVWFQDEEAKKKECLWQILKSIPKIRNLDQRRPPDEGYMAYSIWSATSLPSKGYDSGLIIFDREGHPISSFALNTPLPDKPGMPGIIESLRGGDLLAGTEKIERNGEVAGYVTAAISMASDNIYFMLSDNPYKALFRSTAGEKVFGDFPGGEPTLEIFTPEGDLLFSSGSTPQFLDPRIFQHPDYYEQPRWVEGQRGGTKVDTIIFMSEGKLITLSYPPVTPIIRLTSLMDFLLLSFLLLFFAFIFLWLFSIIRGPARKERIAYPFSWLTSRFYRKLFVSLLLIAVLPMLFLSYLITSSLKNKIESDMRQLGLESAAVAGKLFETFYEYSSWEAEAPFSKYAILSDELATLISEWIRREVHIYINDRLAASSIRGDLPLLHIHRYGEDRLDIHAFQG